LKCGLQKSARRISGWCAEGPSGSGRTGLARRESRCSLTRASRNMPSERVRNTFVERNDLAKYVGHRPLVEDSWYDRRRSEPFAALPPNPESASAVLVRWVKWLPGPRVCEALGGHQLAVGLDPIRRCPSSDRERQRFERRGQGSPSRTGAVGRFSAEMWFSTSPEHRCRSRQSWWS